MGWSPLALAIAFALAPLTFEGKGEWRGDALSEVAVQVLHNPLCLLDAGELHDGRIGRLALGAHDLAPSDGAILPEGLRKLGIVHLRRQVADEDVGVWLCWGPT